MMKFKYYCVDTMVSRLVRTGVWKCTRIMIRIEARIKNPRLSFSFSSNLTNFSNDEPSLMHVIREREREIIVGVCYRPPTQNSFIDHSEEDLCKLRTDCETIILGDFKICTTRKSNPVYKLF